MKNALVLLLSKICLKILKLFGRGSSLPGKIALKLDKNLMKKFKINSKIIAVTGSSGKGSTSCMLVNTLRDLGYTVAHNIKGSNLKFGIASLLVENSNLKGELNQDYIIFEIDERYCKYVFTDIIPDYLIVTNITRDQPPRQGNVDIVLNDIKKSIPKETHIILNADSPYMQNLVLNLKNDVSYFSVGKNNFSNEKSIYSKLNIYYCPKCNTKLEYDYYNFEENGKFECPRCHMQNGDAICIVTKMDLDKNEITINNKYVISTETKLLFNVYNVAACFTALIKLNVDIEKSVDIISKENLNKKLYSSYTYENRNVYVLNNKNENATTFNQSLNFLANYNDKKTILVGWHNISRRYEFNDISWLYDIDFELLNSYDIDAVLCVGTERYDIATRIKLAGIDLNKIHTFETLKESVEYLNKTEGNIYSILNFDYVKPFNNLVLKGASK